MEDTLNKAETPLAEYDSIKLSLKKFRNLGKINNKMNADEQRVYVMNQIEGALTGNCLVRNKVLCMTQLSHEVCISQVTNSC